MRIVSLLLFQPENHMTDQLLSTLQELISADSPFVLTLSSPKKRTKEELETAGSTFFKRAVIKRSTGESKVLIETFTTKQSFTEHVESAELSSGKASLLESFTQSHVQSPEFDLYLRLTNDETREKKTKPSRLHWDGDDHNRRKNYLITTENSRELLAELSMLGKDGSVKPTAQAKYKQINHFLSLADNLDIMQGDTLSIIDCGCGKAYLSLALYHLLANLKGKTVRLVGIDTNDSVIEFCKATATKLGFVGAEFKCMSIDDFAKENQSSVDLLIALHACDTATDSALALGIKAKATAVLSAPCCHHYVNSRLKSDNIPQHVVALMRDGIARERFADLLTDTLRRDILRANGYSAELIEFVSPEHTLKNVMIRAEKTPPSPEREKTILGQVARDIKSWGVAPKLWEMVNKKETS